MVGEGRFEVNAFRLGLGTASVTLVDSGKEAVVVTDGSVGEPYPQRILGIRQLLRDVTAVGPGEVRVGRIGGIGVRSVVVARMLVVLLVVVVVVVVTVGGGLVLMPVVGQQ